MKWDCDSTNEESAKCLSHVKISDGAPCCVTFMSDYKLANWKGEKNKFSKKYFAGLKFMKQK